jgi:hypothetical protein
MKRRKIIIHDSDDDALPAVPCSSSKLSCEAPAVALLPANEGTPESIIAETAAVIVIEDSCSSDPIHTATIPPLTPAHPTADVMVIVGSPCAAVAAGNKARSGSRLFITPPSHHPRTIADFFQPISSAEYRSAVAAAAQLDVMDLRCVVPVSAADDVTAADDDETLSSSLPCPPHRSRHGYEIDDFVVATSESDTSVSESDE